MRNKKSLLSLAILALVLVLGVGYAVVSNETLFIDGTAKTDTRIIDVHFVDEGTITGTGNNAVTATGEVEDDLLHATINVENLSEIGDYAEVTYNVTNEDKDLEAKVTAVVTGVTNTEGTSVTDYYNVTVTPNPFIVAENGGTTAVTVKVELVKVPILPADSEATIAIELTAAPQQPGTGLGASD